MKNWEYNNEYADNPKLLEQQAVEEFAQTILLAVPSKLRAGFDGFDFYEHYKKTYNWLNSEHKED